MAVRMDVGERSGVEIEGVEEERQRVPEWLGEAVLLGQYWLESGLVKYLEEEVWALLVFANLTWAIARSTVSPCF
ncbi:MAG TPA: hypothetical protein IGS53_21490 [Leptolyngbyaceae cyanobacterium M33_DOE_097]|nr:hypothetical protein [Leptolyngbyaceae cyanobacterium M33_DOE_097]